MNEITRIALDWLNMGVVPVPCFWRHKTPKISWKVWETVTPDEQKVKCWFAGEHTNLAIIAGGQGLTVIDFDSFDAYDLWLTWHTATTEQWFIPDNTLRVITGRGVHLYLFVEEPVQTSHVTGVVDIKASGYVLAPPSVHPNGRRYQGNNLPILKVKSLQGIVPDEWLQHSDNKQYSKPEPLSDNPLDNLDRGHVSLVSALLSKWRITDFVQGAPTSNGYLIANCPFHQDHKPSFWIDTQKQLCGCYKGCNSKPMDVINLYARLHGLSNQAAIQELRRL